MNAIAHPTHQHSHHDGHGWTVTGIAGTAAGAVVAAVFAMAVSTSNPSEAGPATPTVVSSRGHVMVPCFRSSHWNDAVSGPIPMCRR